MTVQLTTFSKRKNSTKRPVSFDASRDCTLKDGCSILMPVLRFPKATMDHEYNYIYIPDFARYYWVTDVVYDGALIYYHCAVDVLASWKPQIGQSDQYVLRSASQWDGDIMDMLYPTTVDKRYASVSQSGAAPFYKDFDDVGASELAWFSVGIIGSGGFTTYYLMQKIMLDSVIKYILSDDFAAAVLGEFQLSVSPELKMAIDPLSYITSVLWLPFDVDTSIGTQVSTITIGPVTTPTILANLPYQLDDVNITSKTINFNTLYKHPLTATRGDYLNTSPFTLVTLLLPPFGLIDIDPADLIDASSLQCRYAIDVRTGTANCKIYAVISGDVTEYRYITVLSGRIGIPITINGVNQLSDLSKINVYGRAAAEAAVNMINSTRAGDPISGIVGGLQHIGNAGASMVPVPSTIGSTGGIDSLNNDPTLTYTFNMPVDDDLRQRGRPLCKYTVINLLSGYVLCSDAEIDLPATDAEIDEVINFLNRGFFYE